MPHVRLADGAICVDDRRIPLLAGEMHYWRLSPAYWRKALDQIRALGLEVVSTYIPWEYHELAPGEFDFDGHTDPARNLVAFLDEVASAGLWLFVRPGPYIYAEWTHAGVPERVVTLPRLSDAYRDEADVWMTAVADVLRPRLATTGGRLCLLQADNEFDLFSHWFEEECGLAGPSGFFQRFLAERYKNIAELNRAWGADYANFEQAQACATPPDPADPSHRARAADYWRFQHWATRTGLGWHVERYRALGLDVPIVGNYYPGGDVQNWRDVAEVVDLNGIDWYPRNEFGHDPQAQRRLLDSCRYQRVVSPIAFIAEFESGVWHGFHDYVGVLSPNHYRLMAVSAWLAGIQGVNWYMFVGRDNWYYAPINERGDVRPELGPVFAELHRVAREIDLPTLEKLTETCAVLDPTQIGTDDVLASNPTLSALYEADVDFELYDPVCGRIAKPLMFYAGADWLPREAQQRLVEHVEAGGTLVVGPRWPRRDESFLPYDALGVAPPDRALSRLGKKVELALGAEVGVSEGPVLVWDAPPGEPIVGTQIAGRQQAVENADRWMTRYIGRQWNCGYRQRRGAGELIVLGMPLTADVVRAIQRDAERPFFAQAELPTVKTGLFRQGDDLILFATNMSAATVQCRVRIDGAAVSPEAQQTDLLTGQRDALSGDALLIGLDAWSGGVWRIGPASR